MTRISFHQEKGDPDYGTCMWANFDFDTENYTLQIMSDCGDYSYGWVATPKTESFFHLCKRLDAGYLLNKIADRSQIDDDATYEAALGLFEYDDLSDEQKDDLREAMSSCCNEHEIANAISEFADSNDIEVDGYDVWCCIERDYTVNAKKIVDVYMEHIIPAISKLEAERSGGSDGRQHGGNHYFCVPLVFGRVYFLGYF